MALIAFLVPMFMALGAYYYLPMSTNDELRAQARFSTAHDMHDTCMQCMGAVVSVNKEYGHMKTDNGELVRFTPQSAGPNGQKWEDIFGYYPKQNLHLSDVFTKRSRVYVDTVPQKEDDKAAILFAHHIQLLEDEYPKPLGTNDNIITEEEKHMSEKDEKATGTAWVWTRFKWYILNKLRSWTHFDTISNEVTSFWRHHTEKPKEKWTVSHWFSYGRHSVGRWVKGVISFYMARLISMAVLYTLGLIAAAFAIYKLIQKYRPEMAQWIDENHMPLGVKNFFDDIPTHFHSITQAFRDRTNSRPEHDVMHGTVHSGGARRRHQQHIQPSIPTNTTPVYPIRPNEKGFVHTETADGVREHILTGTKVE